MNNFANAV